MIDLEFERQTERTYVSQPLSRVLSEPAREHSFRMGECIACRCKSNSLHARVPCFGKSEPQRALPHFMIREIILHGMRVRDAPQRPAADHWTHSFSEDACLWCKAKMGTQPARAACTSNDFAAKTAFPTTR